MQPPPETREHAFSQRVLIALTELARLALRTSLSRFSSPESQDQLAQVLLTRLVALCEAQQGAFFMAQRPVDPVAENTQAPFAFSSPLSLLACAQMREEEAYAALAPYDLVAALFQWSRDIPLTLLWRRPLETPGTHLPHADQAKMQMLFQPHALLLFIWPVQDTSFEAREQTMKLLPFLADLVDTILLQISVAWSTREPSEEILPTELLATLGHEFRGPLTSIQGYASTLQHHEQHLLPEERQAFLQAIEQASTHLSQLVERFLLLAQLEAQSPSLVAVPIDLAVLAHEAITAARQRRSHILLHTSSHSKAIPAEQVEEQAGDEELTIVGDRRLLRTLLDLLLENAIAYSAHESLIEVSLHPTDPARLLTVVRPPPNPETRMALIVPAAFQEHEPLLEIAVRDHGKGIPAEQLSQIFRRFYRGDTRLTREVNGLGLGLAVCQAIVEEHQGMLWVESVVGAGSTFHIVLRRAGARCERL